MDATATSQSRAYKPQDVHIFFFNSPAEVSVQTIKRELFIQGKVSSLAD